MLRPSSLQRLAFATVLLAGAWGCSTSTSSASLSESSESSAASSGSSVGDDSASYREDVSDYTAAWAAAGGRDEEAFFSGLGDIARQRGVSDWEAVPATWESIGRGLRRAEIDDSRRDAYAVAWAGDDPSRRHALGLDLAAR